MNTKEFKNVSSRDFPGGPVVKNSPSNAGDVGLIPGRGTKIPQAAEQLSLFAATTEPVRSRACAPQLKSLHAATREKPAHSNEESTRCNKRSCMPQRRSRVLQLRPKAAK